MTIQISFLTVLVKKSAVKRYYHGGEDGFRQDFPHSPEDAYLFGVKCMSGGDTQSVIDQIKQKGLMLGSAFAVADMFAGPIEANPHFEFRTTSLDYPPRWEAQLISDDPQILAEDGSQLITWLMRHNQSFTPPSSAT